MPGPYFTTNEADIAQLEGLYIKERNPPATVSGVNLNVVAVTGETVRGPVGTEVSITSEARFRAVFGGRDYGAGGTLINKVWLSLLNKKFGEVRVVRACAAAAATSTLTVNDSATPVLQIDASSPGLWGDGVEAAIEAATDANADHFNLVLTYLGDEITYENLDISATGVDNTLTVLGDDEANWVVLTKLDNGRPDNASAAPLASGSQGTIADSDFTAANKGINVINASEGVGVCWIAERAGDTLNAAIETLAAADTDRIWIIEPASGSVSRADAVTDVADYRQQRLIYTYNHPYTLDPETATEVQTSPSSWMASILSQTDVDIHPGEEDTKRLLAGITRLTNTALVRADYVAFKAAGICALEKNDGFQFVSGVVTDLTAGKTEITRRRSTDYLQLTSARSLKYLVKKKSTIANRSAMMAILNSFLKVLKKGERIVEDYVIDGEVLNTTEARAAGVERVLMRVKLLGHMLHLVLETEIGTGVVIVTER